MAWKYIHFEEQRYELDHLNDFHFEAIQPATQTKSEMRTEIKVTFGWHCYTRSPEQNETAQTHRNERGEQRCFCPIRYEHSKHLSKIIKELSERNILQTGKGNFLTIKIVDHDGNKRDYEIYFTLRKQEKKKPLKLYVESAYLRDELAEAIRQKSRHQPIKFAILVYKVKNDQKIPYKR